ncbi:MAG: hypothetical protein L6Q95_01745 [Planctomycetes bacterium]|nr:hypothetical protein [Planctomycetota bacterium]
MRVYVGAALTVAVLAASGWRIHVHREHGAKHARHRRRLVDLTNMRGIALMCAQRGLLPMKDGALDPYDLMRAGDLVPEQWKVFQSVRLGIGPTEEEVRRGDYTNFPWARHRGDGQIRGRRFPVLWDKEADEDGFCVVAFSDGSAEVWERDRLERALAEAGDGR